MESLTLDELIERALSVVRADDRITAAWLEGSFAAGTADAWSDVDLYIAVRDADYDAVVAERHNLINQIRPVLGYGENPIPSGFLVYANLQGMLRLDLIFTKESEAGLRPRSRFKVLFDSGQATEKFRLREGLDLRARVEGWVREFSYGSFQPLRLVNRKEWASLQLGFYWELMTHVVPAWLAVDDPTNAFRPQLHNERFLSDARRRQMNSFVTLIHETFAHGEPGPDQLKVMLEASFTLIMSALRAACDRWEVAYPEDVERSIRQTYGERMGLEIPATEPLPLQKMSES